MGVPLELVAAVNPNNIVYRELLYADFSNIVLITAGYVANKMGVPLELVAAINPNDIVYRAFFYSPQIFQILCLIQLAMLPIRWENRKSW
jgi:hypothetical protein